MLLPRLASPHLVFDTLRTRLSPCGKKSTRRKSIGGKKGKKPNNDRLPPPAHTPFFNCAGARFQTLSFWTSPHIFHVKPPLSFSRGEGSQVFSKTLCCPPPPPNPQPPTPLPRKTPKTIPRGQAMLGERKSSGKATITGKARKGNCCHPGFPERTDPRWETETNSRGQKGQIIKQKGLKKGKCKRISFRIIKNLQRPTTVSYPGRFKFTPSHPPRPIPPPPARNLLFAPKTSRILSLPLSPSSKKARLLPPAAKKKSSPLSSSLSPPFLLYRPPRP